MALKNNPTLSDMKEQLISKSTADDLTLWDSKIETHSSVIDENTAPVSTVSNAPLEWYDKDGNLIAHIELQQESEDNTISLRLGIRRYIESEWVWKHLNINVDSNGEISGDFGDDGKIGGNDIIISTTDLTPGVSSLTTDTLYFVYV